jgi:hypothetical protein
MVVYYKVQGLQCGRNFEYLRNHLKMESKNYQQIK